MARPGASIFRKRKRLDLLDAVDEPAVTGMLMDILNLWNRDDQTVEVTERHVKDIRDWLARLDLIATCRVRRSDGTDDMPRTIFTQPGMRYCLACRLLPGPRLRPCERRQVPECRELPFGMWSLVVFVNATRQNKAVKHSKTTCPQSGILGSSIDIILGNNLRSSHNTRRYR